MARAELHSWAIDYAYRQHRGGVAPCGCYGAAVQQVCHYLIPHGSVGLIECDLCRATWCDYAGDEWVYGDGAVDSDPALGPAVDEPAIAWVYGGDGWRTKEGVGYIKRFAGGYRAIPWGAAVGEGSNHPSLLHAKLALARSAVQ